MSLLVILPKSHFFDSDNTPLPMSLGLSITQLWEDPGVQQIYGLSHQFQLNETAKYGNHEYFTGGPLIGRFLGPRKIRLNRNLSY